MVARRQQSVPATGAATVESKPYCAPLACAHVVDAADDGDDDDDETLHPLPATNVSAKVHHNKIEFMDLKRRLSSGTFKTGDFLPYLSIFKSPRKRRDST